MKLIQTQTLVTAQPDITFSAIPQNFTDLYILASARSTTSGFGVHHNLLLRPNGATTNQTDRVLYGTGSAVASNTDTVIRGNITSSGATANTFGNAMFYIPNYAGATNKSVSADSVTENNATEAHQYLTAGLWSSTAAITSLTLLAGAGDLAAGTTISLYGIGGTGDGYAAPKATGGVISYSDGYIIHTFTASGTFTPTESLTDVEYLVVAGGGSGGCGAGGGGGAGGYRSSVTGQLSGANSTAEAKLSLTSGTAYTVTVGAGGAARSGGDAPGFAGTDSVFSTITSAGGGRGAGFTGPGGAGGSGGGSSVNATGGAGTANQGFAGEGSVGQGGGGGGAGELAGTDGAGFGGDGLSSNITGSSVMRGGGGGGQNGAGTQGGDGGGGGSTQISGPNYLGINGTVNTGGGGGGSNGGQSTGAGGSGIVIVRYAA